MHGAGMSYTLYKFGSPTSDPTGVHRRQRRVWLHTLGDPGNPLDTQDSATAIASNISGSIIDGHAQQAPVTPVEVTKGVLVASTAAAP